jgi:hypothetical protein
MFGYWVFFWVSKPENVGFWVWVEFWVATPNTLPKPKNVWVQLYAFHQKIQKTSLDELIINYFSNHFKIDFNEFKVKISKK